LTIVKTKV